MFRYIKKFFMALNANTHPGDIAHAVALGLLLALVPRANLLWAFLFFFTLFIRVNKGAFFLALILLSFVTPFADVLLDALGYQLLSLAPLQGMYRTLYGIPFVGLTMFNNTVVAGSLVVGLVLYIPVVIVFTILVKLYRDKLQQKIAQSRLVKFIMQLPLIKQIVEAPISGGFEQ